MILTIIGNNIRRLRKEKGLRQIDLAVAVGIDSSYLSEIENKKRNPTILLLDNIATVLEVSLVELLSDNQHKD
jgi:transcriptional regulator with XRE-family HTH domain